MNNNSQLSPHITARIDQFIPEYIRANFPDLIEFVKVYFEYLEEHHKSSYYQNTLYDQRNIKTQDDLFLESIESELGLYIPQSYKSSPKQFYHHIIDIWRSKGSEESIKTFFRLFLDEEVVIRYPWDKVLKPSDGIWVTDKKLRVSMINGDGYDFLGQEIQQTTNTGVAKVIKVERKVYSTEVIYELLISNNDIVGEFVPRDNIIVFGMPNLRAEIYRSVQNLSIVNSGSNYKVGDKIELSQFHGSTFTCYVSDVDENGAILDTKMSNFGAGNTPSHIIDKMYFGVSGYLVDYIRHVYESNKLVKLPEPEFCIRTENGSGADFQIHYGAVCETKGSYKGVKGQLSESTVLHDSYFYQKYSYEVITSNSADKWLPALKRTVHPSGVLAFSNVNVADSISPKMSLKEYRDIAVPQGYTFGENLPIQETISIYVQNYAIGEDFYFYEDYAGESIDYASTLNESKQLLKSEKLSLS